MPKQWPNKAIVATLVLMAARYAPTQESALYPGGLQAVRFEQRPGFFHYVVPCRLLIREKYWTGLVSEGPGDPALCWPMNVLQLRKIDGKTSVSPMLQGMLQVSATQLQFLPNKASDASFYLLAPASASGVEHKAGSDMAFFFTGELGYRFGFVNYCIGCAAGASPIDPAKAAQLEDEYSLVAQSLKLFSATYERVRERASFLRVGVSPANQPAAKDIPEAMNLYGALNRRLAEVCPGAPSLCVRQYASYQACAASGKTAECGAVPVCSAQCTLSPKGAKDLQANVCVTEREDYATLTPDWTEMLKRRGPDPPVETKSLKMLPPNPNGPTGVVGGVLGVAAMGMMGAHTYYDGTSAGGRLSVVDCSPNYSYRLARGVFNRAPKLPESNGVAMVNGGVIAGGLVHHVNPVYPAVAKAAHVSGAVTLHAVITPAGTVENLTVISGPELLRASALNAVSQWTYKPYLVNGMPVTVDTTIVVNYSVGM